MGHNNPVELESDEIKMLTNRTTPADGPGNVPICFQTIQQDACQKCQKKTTKIRVLSFSVVVLVLVIFAIVLVFVLVVQRKESPATPCPSDRLCRDWIHNGNWCYCPSDEEQNWDFSCRNCSSSGTSLLTLDSEEDWTVIKNQKKEVWIYLWKEKVDQPWTWPNGSRVTQLDIKGAGRCAYVTGGDKVSSTDCDLIRYWICKKPAQAA